MKDYVGSSECCAHTDDAIMEGSGEPPPALPLVLNIDQLASLLQLNRKTVYAAIASGRIPGVRRIGKALRAHRDTVLTWLAEGQASASRSPRGAR